MKRLRIWLSLLLAFAMLMCPVTVWAEALATEDPIVSEEPADPQDPVDPQDPSEPEEPSEPEPIGWTQIDGAWYYLDADGNPVTSTFVTTDDGTFYLDDTGRLVTGWFKLDGSWYYARSSGLVCRDQWRKISGKYYCFRADGRMVSSGLASAGGYSYFLDSKGNIKTTSGWIKYGGKYYYAAKGGRLYQNSFLEYKGWWYFLGPDCALVTNGWAVSGNKYYYMNANGNMTHGWKNIGGTYYYFGNNGVLYVSRYTPDGYYMGPDGTWDSSVPLKTYAWSGGYYTWEQVSGVKRTSLVSYLTNNWKRYYGTPYSSSPCSIPGVGMHCAGFVARVFYDMGVSNRFYTGSVSYGVEARNKGYLYKSNISSYTNENVWRVRGWLVWADTHYVRWLGYASYEAFLRGAANGDFNKGDIVIIAGNGSYIKKNVTMSHVCFYWGDENNWARIWESSPWKNGIYSRSYYSGQIIVLTSVPLS